MQILVEVLPTQWAVRLTATGATGTVTWRRTVSGRDTTIGTGPALLDRSVPFNQQVTYSAVDSDSLAVADPVTVESSTPVLSSTMSGLQYPVTVASWRPLEGVGRSMWHPVIDRADPPVSVYPMLYPSFTLTLFVAGYGERVELARMLQPGDPLQLRSPSPRLMDSMTFIVTRWSDPYVDEDQRDEGPLFLQLQCQQTTDLVAWQPDATRTYAAVKAEGGTYADYRGRYATYLDAKDGRS